TDFALALLVDDERAGRGVVHAQTQRLDVEDDVGDVLHDTGDRGELVECTLDPHGSHCGTLERAQQDATKAIAQRDPVAPLERLARELSVACAEALPLGFQLLGPNEVAPVPGNRVRILHSRASELLGVELDDQLFIDIRRDVRASGQRGDLALEVVLVELEPCRPRAAVDLAERIDDLLDLAAAFGDLDHVTRPHEVAGDVDLLAVDAEVAVERELAALRVRRAEAEAERDVVQATLEQAQQVLAGHALHARSTMVVAAELLLEQPVHALDLLLLTQLLAVVARATLAALAVLSGGVRTTIVGALLRVAAIALEIELRIFPSAETADGSGITCHGLDPPPLGRTAAVVGDRRHVLDRSDPEPGRLNPAKRGLATRSRTADADRDGLQPVFLRTLGGLVGGQLRRERRRLARATEAANSRRRPGNHVAVHVGDAHLRVVERRLDMHDTRRNVLFDPLAGRLGLRRRCLLLPA